MSLVNSKLAPVQEIGYSFLKSYYERLHEDPKHLHHFYSENANIKCINYPFLKDDQTNFLPQTTKITGKTQVSDFYTKHEAKVKELRFRIDTHEVQSTGLNDSGVFILAMGELCWNNSPSYRFVQTFILTHVSKSVFDITNDLIKFIPDDIVPKMKKVVSSPQNKPKIEKKQEVKQEQTKEVKAEVTPEVVAQSKVESKPEAAKEVEVSTKPEATTETQPEAKPEVKVEDSQDKASVASETQTIPSTQDAAKDKKEVSKEKTPPKQEPVLAKKDESKVSAQPVARSASPAKEITATPTPAQSPASSSISAEAENSLVSGSRASSIDENDDFKTIVSKKHKNKNRENSQTSDNDDGYVVASYGNKHGGNYASKKKTNVNKYGAFPVYIPKTTDSDEEPLRNALKATYGSLTNIFLGNGFVIVDFEHEVSQKKALEIGSITVAPGKSFKIEQKTENKSKVKFSGSNTPNAFGANSTANGEYQSTGSGPYNNNPANLNRNNGFTTVTGSGYSSPKITKKPFVKKT